MSRAKSVRKAAAKLTGMSGAFSGKKKGDAAAAPAPASTQEKVVAKVEETTDAAEAKASVKVAEGGAATDAAVKAAVGPAQ